jgi:hypothetical protein
LQHDGDLRLIRGVLFVCLQHNSDQKTFLATCPGIRGTSAGQAVSIVSVEWAVYVGAFVTACILNIEADQMWVAFTHSGAAGEQLWLTIGISKTGDATAGRIILTRERRVVA